MQTYKECPFLFYGSVNNPRFFSSIPIKIEENKNGINTSDRIFRPVCYADSSNEASTHCMKPSFIKCQTYRNTRRKLNHLTSN